MSKLFLLFFILFITSQTAYGYIDPGTGSYLLQILAAGFLAGMYTVKVYWRNIVAVPKKLFSRKKK